jgi:hypothetical protein
VSYRSTGMTGGGPGITLVNKATGQAIYNEAGEGHAISIGDPGSLVAGRGWTIAGTG